MADRPVDARDALPQLYSNSCLGCRLRKHTQTQNISYNSQPPETLQRDVFIWGLIAAISGLMLRPKHLFLERDRDNNTSRDWALLTMVQQVVFNDQVLLDIKIQL